MTAKRNPSPAIFPGRCCMTVLITTGISAIKRHVCVLQGDVSNFTVFKSRFDTHLLHWPNVKLSTIGGRYLEQSALYDAVSSDSESLSFFLFSGYFLLQCLYTRLAV